MRKVTRRLFLKVAAAIVVVGALGKYFLGRYTEPKEGGIIGSPGEGGKGIPVVSDVDAHSQCRMRVNVEAEKVIEVRGDPKPQKRKSEQTRFSGPSSLRPGPPRMHRRYGRQSWMTNRILSEP